MANTQYAVSTALRIADSLQLECMLQCGKKDSLLQSCEPVATRMSCALVTDACRSSKDKLTFLAASQSREIFYVKNKHVSQSGKATLNSHSIMGEVCEVHDDGVIVMLFVLRLCITRIQYQPQHASQ